MQTLTMLSTSHYTVVISKLLKSAISQALTLPVRQGHFAVKYYTTVRTPFQAKMTKLKHTKQPLGFFFLDKHVCSGCNPLWCWPYGCYLTNCLKKTTFFQFTSQRSYFVSYYNQFHITQLFLQPYTNIIAGSIPDDTRCAPAIYCCHNCAC